MPIKLKRASLKGCSLRSDARQIRQLRQKGDKFKFVVALFLFGAIACAASTDAAELKQKTSAAFDYYVELSEAAMQTNISTGSGFLAVDRLSLDKRRAALDQIKAGQTWIEREKTSDNGKPISVPGGMIHDWTGTVFIPGVTLDQTLHLVQDYNNHQNYFRPDVVRSAILNHRGDEFLIYYRLHRKKVLTVILDTDHLVDYHIVSATRAWSASRTTRVQQVEDAGEPNEHLDPPGHDGGYLWRMNTYWRFEQKDGGTYVECRSISLSRDIPVGLGWMIEPLVKAIPEESLAFTLGTTRAVLMNQSRRAQSMTHGR
jgi:hypothetical protein